MVTITNANFGRISMSVSHFEWFPYYYVIFHVAVMPRFCQILSNNVYYYTLPWYHDLAIISLTFTIFHVAPMPWFCSRLPNYHKNSLFLLTVSDQMTFFIMSYAEFSMNGSPNALPAKNQMNSGWAGWRLIIKAYPK